MAKSKGRHPKTRAKPTQHPPQPQRQPPQQTRVRRNILRSLLDHPIAGLVGLLAAIATIVAMIVQAMAVPKVWPDPDTNAAFPFEIPFHVTNTSWLFAMKDANFICGIDVIKLTGHRTFSNFSVLDAKTATIETGGSVSYRCIFGGKSRANFLSIAANEVVSAHIFVRVTYYTLLWKRTSPEVEFTWFTNTEPPRWIEGKIID